MNMQILQTYDFNVYTIFHFVQNTNVIHRDQHSTYDLQKHKFHRFNSNKITIKKNNIKRK